MLLPDYQETASENSPTEYPPQAEKIGSTIAPHLSPENIISTYR